MIHCDGCDKTGGKFTFRGEKWYCPACYSGPTMRSNGSNLWPLVTTHLTGDGKPVVIENLRQLRAAENRYGVHSAAWSDNTNNWARTEKG